MGDKFTYTPDGSKVSFTFEVTNDEKNTVVLTGIINTGTNAEEAAVNIPGQVIYGSKTYTVSAIADTYFDGYSPVDVVIPASVTKISPSLFWGIVNTVTIVDDNPVYYVPKGSNAIVEKSTKTLVTAGKEFVITSDIEAIGAEAFCSRGNYNVTIPKSIKSIGDYAFSSGYNIVVKVEHETPLEISDNVFENIGGAPGGMLRVPVASWNAYREAKGWNVFKAENVLKGNEGVEFKSDVSNVPVWFTITSIEGEKTAKLGKLMGLDAAIDEDDFKMFYSRWNSFDIPETVTYEGEEYKVTEISDYAFFLRGIESVSLPQNLRKIGKSAFELCGIESLVIPKNVTFISEGAIQSCPLKSLTVEEGNSVYESVGNNIIEKDGNRLIAGTYKSIIPSTVKTIAPYAFCGVSNARISIPRNVSSIGEYAFAYCRNCIFRVKYGNMKEATLGYYAFGNAVNGNNILAVPEDMVEIYKSDPNWGVFGANIQVATEIVEFETEIADGLYMWFSVNGEGTVKVGKLNGDSSSPAVDRSLFASYDNPKFTSLTIPDYVTYDGNTYKVTEIGGGAFYYIDFTSLVLPSTLEKMSVDRFGGGCIEACSYLTTLEIPKSVTSISEGAFSSGALKSLTVEDGNPNYYSYSNAVIDKVNHTLLVGTSVTKSIPEDVTKIAGGAFAGVSDLNLELPLNIVSIDESAFGGCKGVITAKWSDNLPKIHAEAFSYVDELALKVPVGAKSTYLATEGWNVFPAERIFEGDEGDEFTVKVGSEQIEMTFTVIESSQDSKKVKVGRLNGDYNNRAVSSEVKYTSIEIPETVTYKGESYTVTELGEYCFYSIEANAITLPSTLETIRKNALVMIGLSKIVIPKNVTKIELGGLPETEIITVEPGNSVYAIMGNALIENGTRLIAGCNKTIIPYTVTEIADGAFGGMRSANMTIPSSVVSIGSYAFAHCYNCKFFVESPVPAKISSDAFSSLDNCSLVVPKGSVEAYESADGWHWFKGNISEGLAGTEFQSGIGYNKIQVWFTITGANTVKVGRLEGSETNMAVDASQEWRSLSIPETVKYEGTTYNVTEIGSYAFYALSEKSIEIPQSVIFIGEKAFANCDNCRLEVSWMDPITVDETAFLNVSEKFGRLTVPAFSGEKYRNSVGWNAFKNRISESAAFQFEIQDGIKAWFVWTAANTVKIGKNALRTSAVDKNLFDWGTVYTSLTVPESISIEDYNLKMTVTEVGDYAFNNLWGLETVILPSTIEKLGSSVFSSCYSIESIVIPKNVTAIDKSAFSNCSKLKDVYSEIKEPFAIDASVFNRISSDAVLHVPFGCKALYEAAEGWKDAFSQIVEMKEEIVTNDVTYEMTDDNKVEVKTAEVNRTTGSVSIAQTVVVNDVAVTVTSIAPKAFQNAEAVKSVTIPATITSIGELAFAGCTNLKEVLCLNPTPVNLSVAAARGLLRDGNSGSTVSQFDGVNLGGCTLYVLTAAENDYRNATGWNSFGTIKAFAGMGDVNTDKSIDVSDVVSEVNQILGKASDGFLYGAGDMNADNSIDVSDVVSIVNVILGKTAGARSMERQSAVAETTASDHLSLMADNEGGLSLVLDNTADYIAAQFDVRLSEGQTLEQVVKGQRARGHQLATAKVADDTYRVLLYTIGDRTFSGQSGEVVNLGVAGEGDVTVENITFITAGESRKKFDDLSNQLTGIGATLNDNGEMINDKAVWHDLQGHKLETAPTSKGVYLKNGKKVVVK